MKLLFFLFLFLCCFQICPCLASASENSSAGFGKIPRVFPIRLPSATGDSAVDGIKEGALPNVENEGKILPPEAKSDMTVPMESKRDEKNGENVLKIAQYIQMALDYDPELAIALIKLKQSDSQLNKAKADFLPELTASGGLSYSYNYENQTSSPYTPSSAFNASYVILSAGTREKAYEKALVDLAQAKTDAELIKDSVIYNAITAFNNLLKAQVQLSIHQQELYYYQKLLSLSNARDPLGGEFSRATVLLTHSEQRLVKAREELDLRLEDFAWLIGSEPSPELVADTNLKFIPIMLDERELVKKSFENRRDFLQIEYAIFKQSVIISQTKKAGGPSASVSVSYGWAPCSVDIAGLWRRFFYENKPELSVGFSVSIPIFDAGKRKEDLNIEKDNLLILEHRRENLRRTVIREVRQSVNAFESAKKRYLLSGNTVEKARKNLSGIFEKYARGLAELEQVDQVIGAFRESAVAQIQAKIDYYNSLALVKKSAGIISDYYSSSIKNGDKKNKL